MRGWGRDGLGTGARGRGREGAEGVDVAFAHGRLLLTLHDTVEFFNLILGTPLTAQEKADLVAFLRAL